MEFKYIMRNPLFINGALGRSILLGVNTAFHYWISDYMKNAIHIENPHVIFWSYTLMNIGGPVGGVFAGSFIQYFFGGYENKHSASVLLANRLLFRRSWCRFSYQLSPYSSAKIRKKTEKREPNNAFFEKQSKNSCISPSILRDS